MAGKTKYLILENPLLASIPKKRAIVDVIRGGE